MARAYQYVKVALLLLTALFISLYTESGWLFGYNLTHATVDAYDMVLHAGQHAQPEGTDRDRPAPRSKQNVVFIVLDDMRPQTNTYLAGDGPKMHTPNLDRLATQSMVFMEAYSQYSQDGPSRTSLMTGRRPDSTKVWNEHDYWRRTGGNYSSLPQYFKNHGYITQGLGKIFHPLNTSNNNDPPSWTHPYFSPTQPGHHTLAKDSSHIWHSVSQRSAKKNPLPDLQVNQAAISWLKKFNKYSKYGESTKPFFLALGYKMPSFPIEVPAAFYQHYNIVDPPRHPSIPEKMPEVAWRDALVRSEPELQGSNYTSKVGSSINLPGVLELRRAYYAAVSFVDALVGQVVDELEDLDLASSTVVVVVSDNGVHLGEQGIVGTDTLFDTALRVPFLLKIPGRTDAGIKSEAVVELVDVFPTVAEAAGLPSPANCVTGVKQIPRCTDGVSLMPLLSQPDLRIHHAVLSQSNTNPDIIGYSIRTKRFRYTEWLRPRRTHNRDGSVTSTLEWRSLAGKELYDLYLDPLETKNVHTTVQYELFEGRMKRLLHEMVQQTVTSFPNRH